MIQNSDVIAIYQAIQRILLPYMENENECTSLATELTEDLISTIAVIVQEDADTYQWLEAEQSKILHSRENPNHPIY